MSNYNISEDLHLKKKKKTKAIYGESIEDVSINNKVKRKRKVEDYLDNTSRRREKKILKDKVLEGFEERDDGKVKKKRIKSLELENDDYKSKKKKKKTNKGFEKESEDVCYNQESAKRKRKIEKKDYHDCSSKSKKKKKLKNEEVLEGFGERKDGIVKGKRSKSLKLKNDDHKRKKKKQKSKKKEYDSCSKSESISVDESSVKKLKEKKKVKKLENKKAFVKQHLPELPVIVSDKNKKEQSKKNSKQVYECHPIHFDWHPSQKIQEKFQIRQGRWTKAEEKMLKENMERYLSENKLDDPSNLIFAYLREDKTDEGQKWKEFAKTTDFYRKIAKGINRSLFSIYRKVLRNFDKQNYLGTFSESEDIELKRLFDLYGNKWEKIGRFMQRSGKSVNWRFCRLSGEGGKWKDSEVELLKEAVRMVSNTTEGEEVFSNISWLAVASIVKTRNCSQCRNKWIGEVCWKDCNSSTKRKWGVLEELKLIKKVYETSVTEEVDIDWYKLYKNFDMARSPEWLHNKFRIIIKKYCDFIPIENRDFENIIDYLYNVKMKELQKQFDYQETYLE